VRLFFVFVGKRPSGVSDLSLLVERCVALHSCRWSDLEEDRMCRVRMVGNINNPNLVILPLHPTCSVQLGRNLSANVTAATQLPQCSPAILSFARRKHLQNTSSPTSSPKRRD
jgi:hypothetical protein